MNKIIAWAAIAGLSFSMCSCAAVFKGSHERVTLASDPMRAAVYINGEFAGETPLRMHLRSGRDYVVEFRKEGFEPTVRQLNSRIGAGWIVLDVIAGMLPVLIDAVTGSWGELDQHHLDVVLRRQQP